jgi:predicted porin
VQLEQTIRIDEGAGSYADRDSFVGLRGDFGTLKIGQFDTPLKVIRGKVDQFGDRVGDIRNVSRVSGGTIGNVFDERFDDNAAFRICAGGRGTQLPAIAGKDSTGLSLGIIYRF